MRPAQVGLKEVDLRVESTSVGCCNFFYLLYIIIVMSFEDPSLIKSIQEVRITQVHNKGGILNIYLTLDNNYCLTCGQDGSLILCNPYKSTIIHKYEGM